MAKKPVPATRKLAVLEDSVLISMANNSNFLAEFPVLSRLKGMATSRNSSCASCNKGTKAAATRAATLNQVKQGLASMGNDRIVKLKSMLNAEKLRVTYISGKDIKQHTF